MALKAGRVGVAPSEVDEFGQIIGEITPTSVYTKQEANARFATKSSVEDDISDVYGVMGDNGAKNKLSFGTVASDDSLTAVDNGVSGITVSGSKTSGHWSDIKITMKNPVTLKAGLLYKMVYSGTIPADVWGIRLRSDTTDVAYLDKGETEKTFSVNSDTIINAWWITYGTNYAVSDVNFTYFPMLIDARDTDNTFQPYAMTNKDLTEFTIKLNIDLLAASSFDDFKTRMSL